MRGHCELLFSVFLLLCLDVGLQLNIVYYLVKESVILDAGEFVGRLECKFLCEPVNTSGPEHVEVELVMEAITVVEDTLEGL